MTFPLPPGCRKVCRPQRSPPRVVGIDEVVRFARSAVKNGAVPCDVAMAVMTAVGCVPCEAAVRNVRDGLDALAEALADLIKAIAVLIREIAGLKWGKDEQPTGPNVRIRTFWEKVVIAMRKALRLWALNDIVEALLNVQDAWNRFMEVLSEFRAAASELADCVEGVSDEKSRGET